ncbi:MAG TPA: thiolase family protein, partial [Actinopolymorphaceae bacterium]
ESVSTAPTRSIDGVPYDRARFAPPPYADPEMGAAADALAREAGISRERQDAYAARSHARALAALESKRFVEEIVPVGGVDRDDRPRAGITRDRLARLPAAFVEGGTVTAGNSCGVNDGAAAVALVPASRLDGVAGLRVLDWACVGCDPALPGLGPVPAVRAVLERQGLELEDIGAIEIVEAFAGQVLACADALEVDPERLCREGGAIALGHPWGASGAVVMVRLFGQLVRHDGPDLGLACAAIGGGMGIAVLVERVGRRVSEVGGDEGATRAANKTPTATTDTQRVGRRVR